MKQTKITLKTVQDVRDFVNTVILTEFEVDLVQGRYTIDAKSIMGIFSLDLSKPIDLNIHAEDSAEEVLETLKPYMI